MKREESQKRSWTARLRQKRGWVFSVLLAALVALAACTPPSTGSGTVESVSINEEPFTIEVGSTHTLTATVIVTGTASTNVNWSSSSTAVASVSNSGVVTGNAPGSATITATSVSDSTKSDSVTVTVLPAGPDEVVPPTATFTATPEEVDLGDSATLSWTVDGDYDSIRITQPGGVVASGLDPTGTYDVSPTSTVTYTLEVSYDDGLLVTATARVAVRPAPEAPDITSFTAQVVRGSQIQFDWTQTGGTSWDVVAFGDGVADQVLGSGTSDFSSLTAAIPASTNLNFRLEVFSGPTTSTIEEIPAPTTIVTTTADYDRYDAGEFEQEEAIPGSLRAVVHTAPAGSVIGFAADITEIQLPGVDMYRGVSPIVDAHIVIDKDLVISGPAGVPVSLVGASNQPEDDPSEPLTWHSRMVFVAAGVTAELENLELTGGDFIYYGAGINNAGTLTVTNLRVAGNRAFGAGGGIRNAPTGVLTIVDSIIEDNGAFTSDSEVGVTWLIRGGPGGLTTGTPQGDGGGIRNEAGGVITITNSVIANNHARFSGGGINNSGDLTLTDTDVDSNVADFTQYTATSEHVSYGGGISNADGASVTMTGGSLSNNSAAEQGGGYWHGRNATGTLSGVTIEGNIAGLGTVRGFGGGILHNYYSGEESNLDHATVSYGSGGNVANNRDEGTIDSDYEFVDRGIRPAGSGGMVFDMLDYRISPAAPR